MIDVTFLLLIFFMCTLQFRQLEGKLTAHLPKDAGVNHQKSERLPALELRIEVEHPGARLWAGAPGEGTPFDPREHARFRFGEDRQLTWSLGPRRFDDFESFATHLLGRAEIDPDFGTRAAVLDARSGVVYGEVVRVLDLLRESGLSEVRFAGPPRG